MLYCSFCPQAVERPIANDTQIANSKPSLSPLGGTFHCMGTNGSCPLWVIRYRGIQSRRQPMSAMPPIATKSRDPAKCRDGPEADIAIGSYWTTRKALVQ